MDSYQAPNERSTLLRPADMAVSEEAPVDPFTLKHRFSCYDCLKVRPALSFLIIQGKVDSTCSRLA